MYKNLQILNQITDVSLYALLKKDKKRKVYNLFL